MIYITDTKTNILVEGDELNTTYPYNGILSIPYNSTLVMVGANTNMVVFKSVANFDTQFTALIGELYISGELVTKDNVVEKFNAIANVLPRGTGGGDIGGDCCATLQDNQSTIIAMIANLNDYKDIAVLDAMLDEINGETNLC